MSDNSSTVNTVVILSASAWASIYCFSHKMSPLRYLIFQFPVLRVKLFNAIITYEFFAELLKIPTKSNTLSLVDPALQQSLNIMPQTNSKTRTFWTWNHNDFTNSHQSSVYKMKKTGHPDNRLLPLLLVAGLCIFSFCEIAKKYTVENVCSKHFEKSI